MILYLSFGVLNSSKHGVFELLSFVSSLVILSFAPMADEDGWTLG
jgi:hypothetical protein